MDLDDDEHGIEGLSKLLEWRIGYYLRFIIDQSSNNYDGGQWVW